MSHHGLPQYDTRWYDKDKRVTRKGFLDGCLERKVCTFNNGSHLYVELFWSQERRVYVVRRSDCDSFAFDCRTNVWWSGLRVKTARKVMTAMVQGRPVEDALRNKAEG